LAAERAEPPPDFVELKIAIEIECLMINAAHSIRGRRIGRERMPSAWPCRERIDPDSDLDLEPET
jgi:hypothetical protein